MKILLLGGTGIMGSSVARDLIKSDEVDKLIIADINPDLTKVHASIRESKKVSTQKIDVADFQNLVKTIKGNDVVVNCVGPYYKYGLHTMRAAIQAGVNYLDIMDDYDTTLAAFELDDQAKKAGLTLCIGCGSSPGFENILVKYAANKLDQVDEVRILWGYTLNDTGGAGVVVHMFHALQGNVPQFLDGKITYVPAGSGVEEVDFIEPFGKCPVYYVGHPEPITIPRYIKGIKTVVNKAGIMPLWGNDLFKDLIERGFASDEPIVVQGHEITPAQFTAQFIQNSPSFKKHVEEWTTEPGKLIVRGKEGDKAVTYIYDSSGRMAPATGIPASICTQMLGKGEIKVKGVVAPEGCIDPKVFLARFAKRGFRFAETKVVTQEVQP